jgi:[ribosomal protein S5]-alanine N-acetyltransferase
LETRWEQQNISKIKKFVKEMTRSDNNFLFAIIEKSTLNHIGNIKIGSVNKFHNFAEISYFIGDRDSWGRGYGTEAVKALTEYSFKNLGLEVIIAGVYQSNIGSQRVLEKAGYSLEGSISNQFLNSNGDREDHLYYSISK